MRAVAELGARTAACQSGAHLAVEERARQQRQQHQHHLCAERQRREAVAATVNHAYRLAIEHRERQRRAAAEEAAAQRAQWQAAAAAAGSRHGTVPGGRRSVDSPPSYGSRGKSGSGSSAAVASAYPGAAHFHAASRSKDQARFWMLYTAHYRRLYGGTAPADADDCWGRMAAAAAAAAADGGSPEDEFFAAAAAEGAASSSRHAPGSNHAGTATAGQESSTYDDHEHSCFCQAASSAFAYWRDFARQAAAGFGFASSFPGAQGEPSDSGSAGSASGTTGSQHQQHQDYQQHQQGTSQQQHNQHRQRWQQAGAYAAQRAPRAAPAGASLEQQVRAELAALLAASGGDLAAFVSALGIPFERGPDATRTLRNARRAAMLSLHPDRLLQQGERQQLWGHHATMLVNELWHASVAA